MNATPTASKCTLHAVTCTTVNLDTFQAFAVLHMQNGHVQVQLSINLRAKCDFYVFFMCYRLLIFRVLVTADSKQCRVIRGRDKPLRGAMMATNLLVELRKSKRAKRVWSGLGKVDQVRMSTEMWSAIDTPSEDCKILGCARIRGLSDIEAYWYAVRTQTAFIHMVEIEHPREQLMVLDIILRHRFLTYEPRPHC